MAKRMLLEDTWEFIPDRTRITEAQLGGRLKAATIPGVLSQCDVVNGNKRRYPRAVWENNLKDGSKLQTLIKRRAAFGLLEHPESGTIDLQSPISHAVTSATLQPDGTVCGEITILEGEGFPDGNKLRGLIEFGYNPLVSSRGYGSVSRVENEIDEVQSDYICEGWDVVMTPSFTAAQLAPVRESSAAAVRPAASLVVENQGKADSGLSAHRQATENIMDINTIRQAATALKSVDILKAGPRVVAESYSQVTALHRALSEVQAATPAASWDCTTLHEELNAIEKSWTESIQATLTENAKLRKDRDSLVVIAEQMTKTARLYRTQLTETTQKRNATAKLYEAVAQRARGWHAIAVKRGGKAAELEHQAQVACRAIDILAEKLVKTETGEDRTSPISKTLDELAEQYHRDTVKLARRIVELQKPADAGKPEIKEKLNAAKTADEVLAILAELEKPAAANTPPAAPPVNESAAASAPTSPAADTAPTATSIQEGITAVLGEQLGHQLSFEQSVSVARRMSRVVEPKAEPVKK